MIHAEYYIMKGYASLAKSKVIKIIDKYDFLKKMPDTSPAAELYDYLQQYYKNNTSFWSNFCSVWEKIHKALKIGSNASNQEKGKAAILTVVYANTPGCRKKARRGLLKLMRKNGDGKDYEEKCEQLAKEYGVSIQLIKCKTVKNPNAPSRPKGNSSNAPSRQKGNSSAPSRPKGNNSDDALLPEGEWDDDSY